MLGSQGTQVFAQACAAICKRAFVFRGLPDGSQQPRIRIDHNGFPGRGPHGEVARLIAGVVEAALPEFTDEPRSLAFPGEIDVAVTRENQIEDLEVIGNLLSESPIAGGREHHRSALVMFGAQILHERATVGKERRVELHSLGNRMLQVCAPPEEPHRQGKECERPLPQQSRERLDQQIGFYERAVQIHDQRAREVGSHRRGARARVARLHKDPYRSRRLLQIAGRLVHS